MTGKPNIDAGQPIDPGRRNPERMPTGLVPRNALVLIEPINSWMVNSEAPQKRGSRRSERKRHLAAHFLDPGIAMTICVATPAYFALVGRLSWSRNMGRHSR